MTNEEMLHKLEYLKDYLYDTLDNESAEAVKQAIETLKFFEDIKQEDIVIKLRNDREQNIAKIVFRSSGLRLGIMEKEMEGCWVHDVDSYNDNEVTYKIDLNQDIESLENYSNTTLLSELKSRLKE